MEPPEDFLQQKMFRWMLYRDCFTGLRQAREEEKDKP
jgi:hypothetical protein